MKKATESLVLLLLVFPPVGTGAQDPQTYQLSVNVDLVVLNATVRDPKGRVAPDLRLFVCIRFRTWTQSATIR
jgi:hypothetical protein